MHFVPFANIQNHPIKAPPISKRAHCITLVPTLNDCNISLKHLDLLLQLLDIRGRRSLRLGQLFFLHFQLLQFLFIILESLGPSLGLITHNLSICFGFVNLKIFLLLQIFRQQFFLFLGLYLLLLSCLTRLCRFLFACYSILLRLFNRFLLVLFIYDLFIFRCDLRLLICILLRLLRLLIALLLQFLGILSLARLKLFVSLRILLRFLRFDGIFLRLLFSSALGNVARLLLFIRQRILRHLFILLGRLEQIFLLVQIRNGALVWHICVIHSLPGSSGRLIGSIQRSLGGIYLTLQILQSLVSSLRFDGSRVFILGSHVRLLGRIDLLLGIGGRLLRLFIDNLRALDVRSGSRQIFCNGVDFSFGCFDGKLLRGKRVGTTRRCSRRRRSVDY
mmetsp:Transcript_28848/g.44847  ORF Transcript_28848/g.44847 Transcript_28848/m.44847 type:complete len:391 (-) Transcript_28848:324-1496(-)